MTNVIPGYQFCRARLDPYTGRVEVITHTVKSAGAIYATVDPSIGNSRRIRTIAVGRYATTEDDAKRQLLDRFVSERETRRQQVKDLDRAVELVTDSFLTKAQVR